MDTLLSYFELYNEHIFRIGLEKYIKKAKSQTIIELIQAIIRNMNMN